MLQFLSIFLFASIPPLFDAAESGIIEKFSFDISNEKIIDEDGKKIKEAKGRLTYAHFELDIQTELLKEFNRVVSTLNYVYGDNTLGEDKFEEQTFLQRAIWALAYEIDELLEMVHHADPNRELRFQELDAETRKYFIQTDHYPLSNEGLGALGNWREVHLRPLMAYGQLIVEPMQNELGEMRAPPRQEDLRAPFHVNVLDPVLAILTQIMDAPAVPNEAQNMQIDQENNQQHQQEGQNEHQQQAAGPSNQQQEVEYFDNEGRKELKRLSAAEMSLQADLTWNTARRHVTLKERHRIAHVKRRISALQTTRIHFESFYMRLNAIWLLLTGIAKFIRPPPPTPFMQKPQGPQPAIKIMQLQHQYTKDYVNLNVEFQSMTRQFLILTNQFMAELGKMSEQGNAAGTPQGDLIMKENKEIFLIARDHNLQRWGTPKNPATNLLALDAADLYAFTDFTGHPLDRRHFAMVLHRQLLTEVAALRIVQHYVEARKGNLAKYAQQIKNDALFRHVDFYDRGRTGGALF